MADSARPPAPRAVFLSYTTEDLATASAVCEALRDAGIEVWMDRSELQGGDAWDENIQRQIRECALIIPIISARTQARREGYFRLEWRLADERMRLVAEGTPLILPVVADDTRQADALVPKSFLTVQWSRLPHGHVPPALVLRVRKLLGMETPGASATLPPMVMPALPVGAAPLEDEPAIGQPNEKTKVPSGPFWRRPLPLVLGSICAGVLLGVLGYRSLRPAPAPDAEPKPVVRFAHHLPPGVSFRSSARPLAALSPDGQSFVYSTTTGLFIRRLNELNAHRLVGPEQVLENPIFSPDGQWVVFVSQATGERHKVSVNGGASVRIGPGAPSATSSEDDGTSLYTQPDGIRRVPADGSGKPEQIIAAKPDERLSAPQLLPGGKYVVFHSRRADGAQVEVGSLADGRRKVVAPGGRHARYVSSTGHLLYMVESDLFGVAYDVERLATIGNPVSLVQGIRLGGTSRTPNYSISRDGTLLYLAGGSRQRIPVWVDRQGKEEPVKLEPSAYGSPRISPDGAKIVMSDLLGGKSGFLVWDFAGETRTRLTQTDPVVPTALWTPDGLRVVYSHFGAGLMVKPANNTRPPEDFMKATTGQYFANTTPLFFTSDGRKLVFASSTRLGSIPLGSDEKPTWLLNVAGSGAALSPDGKWIAYQAEESERREIFVSPFPNVTDDRVPISKEGGAQPLWSRDGKELFYVGGNGSVFPAPLMAATVQTDGGKFTVVARKPVWNPTPLYFTTPTATNFRNYDLSPDGERFIVLKDVKPDGAAEAPEQIVIVHNWTEELKRRVPWPAK